MNANDYLDRITTQVGNLAITQPIRARQAGAELTFSDAFGRTTTFRLHSPAAAAQALRSALRDLQGTFDSLRILVTVMDLQNLRPGAAAHLAAA